MICFVQLIFRFLQLPLILINQLKTVAIDDMLCLADFQISSVGSYFIQSIEAIAIDESVCEFVLISYIFNCL